MTVMLRAIKADGCYVETHRWQWGGQGTWLAHLSFEIDGCCVDPHRWRWTVNVHVCMLVQWLAEVLHSTFV